MTSQRVPRHDGKDTNSTFVQPERGNRQQVNALFATRWIAPICHLDFTCMLAVTDGTTSIRLLIDARTQAGRNVRQSSLRIFRRRNKTP